MDLTRRQFASTLAATLVLPRSLYAAEINSTIVGVPLGVQTYSFHQIQVGGPEAVTTIIQAMTRIGLGFVEIFAQDLSPFPMPIFAVKAWLPPGAPAPRPSASDPKRERAAVRAWRLNTPDSYFAGIGQQFRNAGIRIVCYNFSFEPSMTDAEIDKGFDHARALGTSIITASTTLTMAKRLLPFIEKHRMTVSFHGHSNIKDPDQFATPESFEKALAMSPFYQINLDIGHFAAAGFDPVPFIEKHHAEITNLHIKDRKKNDGANEPFGQGDTPIRQVLLLLRDRKYHIPALIEYEYVGSGTPNEEVAKAFAYEKQILNS